MTSSAIDTDGHHDVGWRFDNTYARLPEAFQAPALPIKVPEPRIAVLNAGLADELGLNFRNLADPAAASLFAGQTLPPGSQPIAQAYAGHQYGHFTMLGDGRAILLGEHRTPAGVLVDIQWKGAGPTRFSRRGDGRAALGPMLREYLISEAMAALGIPTTRSLAVVTTGDAVYRATPLRGAILTRVAASHIRVGTFEYAARTGNPANLQLLADYTIARHYPDLRDSPQKYLDFLRAVIDRQAALIAQWQLVGFIHGVMNTDNMAISGETIDYGPCAFMNAYHPDTVFSSIDQHGRYAYRNQPAIAQWNLTRLAETLLPLQEADQEQAVAISMTALEEFAPRFQAYLLSGMCRKLGLQDGETGDLALVQSLLDWMQATGADFTNTFRELTAGVQSGTLAEAKYQTPDFNAWQTRWRQRLQQAGEPLSAVQARMQAANPAVVPRNHLVEEALTAAEAHNDFTLFQQLLSVCAAPYDHTLDVGRYQEPSPDDDRYQTFCGT